MFETAGEYGGPTAQRLRRARRQREHSTAENLWALLPSAECPRPTRQSGEFLADVWQGLGVKFKRLPCKYLYDKRGSELFDRICATEEYYVTRTEIDILRRDVADICEGIGPGCLLVELGSGSSVKTRILLDHLDAVRAYMPVDISAEHLRQIATVLRAAYPELPVYPLAADFASELPLEEVARLGHRTIVFFPGSTIGNFSPLEARRLFRGIALTCGPHGGLLIGFDLQKPRAILDAAYNDAGGVTAQFTLNLLVRINRELDGNFDLSQFQHEAVYEENPGRMRISLVSLRQQEVVVGGRKISLEHGERILTEHSYKYTLDSFGALLSRSGLVMRSVWTDPRKWFAVALCETE